MIIDGRFAGGLRVGIIPMHIVARGRFRGQDEALVFHSSENKNATPPLPASDGAPRTDGCRIRDGRM